VIGWATELRQGSFCPADSALLARLIDFQHRPRLSQTSTHVRKTKETATAAISRRLGTIGGFVGSAPHFRICAPIGVVD